MPCLRTPALLVLLLAASAACDQEPDRVFESLDSACRETDTTPSVTASDITAPPTGVQTELVDYYAVTKYLKVQTPEVHIFGTNGVSDWMMVRTHEMAEHVLAQLNSASDRNRFSGHHIFAITDDDPTVPNGWPGQRNTGGAQYTIVNEVLVCATAVDTIRPDDPAIYRAWDTPVHEFGHAVELVLDLRETSIEIHERWDPGYSVEVSGEYFAWASQFWFNAGLTGACGVDALQPYDAQYFLGIFSGEEIWRPSCAGRP